MAGKNPRYYIYSLYVSYISERMKSAAKLAWITFVGYA